MITSPIRTTVLFISLLVLISCSQKQTFSYIQPDTQSKENRDHKHQFMAGAAIRDITPPPGMPRAGSGTLSGIGNGFRTRLKVRAYYMEDNQGTPYGLVQTDLLAGSRILLIKVAELVNKKTGLDASSLTITSTHTHSSPGNYFGSEFYNRNAAKKSGFDLKYFNFISNQIANAVIEAYEKKVPAKLAIGKKEIWGLTRNRSLPAFKNNRDHNISNLNSGAYHAINPNMYMIRLDGLTKDGNYKPIGAFFSFSIHATTINQHELTFDNDLWSYIHGDLQQYIEDQYKSKDVVIGGFQGTHGDMTPAIPVRQLGYLWSRKIGKSLAKHGWELFNSLDNKLQSDVSIQTATRYINLREKYEINGISICDKPAMGITALAGPTETETPILHMLPFFKQGSSRWFNTEGCQGNRSIALGEWLQSIIEPTDDFPDDVIFQLIKINDLVLAPLPFELTVETGNRMESAIKKSFADMKTPINHVVLSSLANGISGYVTTQEEYEIQYYEGGHTIYGQYSQPYLTEHLRILALDLASGKKIRELPKQWKFNFETHNFIQKTLLPDSVIRRTIEQPDYIFPQLNKEGHWSFSWHDLHVDHMDFHNPLLSIEVSENLQQWSPLKTNGAYIDDQGYDIGVIKEDQDEQHSSYRGYWYNPSFNGKKYWYRFKVAARKNQPTLYSKPFQ